MYFWNQAGLIHQSDMPGLFCPYMRYNKARPAYRYDLSGNKIPGTSSVSHNASVQVFQPNIQRFAVKLTEWTKREGYAKLGSLLCLALHFLFSVEPSAQHRWGTYSMGSSSPSPAVIFSHLPFTLPQQFYL
jgi:hypothetical protein